MFCPVSHESSEDYNRETIPPSKLQLCGCCGIWGCALGSLCWYRKRLVENSFQQLLFLTTLTRSDSNKHLLLESRWMLPIKGFLLMITYWLHPNSGMLKNGRCLDGSALHILMFYSHVCTIMTGLALWSLKSFSHLPSNVFSSSS